ncbi:Plasma membrane ATPase, partial [Mucuna pruriens]
MENLEKLKKESIDLVVAIERIPVDQVFEQLDCSKEGLSNEEGQKRLELFGPNKLEEKKAMNYLYLTIWRECCSSINQLLSLAKLF